MHQFSSDSMPLLFVIDSINNVHQIMYTYYAGSESQWDQNNRV